MNYLKALFIALVICIAVIPEAHAQLENATYQTGIIDGNNNEELYQPVACRLRVQRYGNCLVGRFHGQFVNSVTRLRDVFYYDECTGTTFSRVEGC